MVYGIPVYNTVQREVTFSLDRSKTSNIEEAWRTGLVTYKNTDDIADN